MMDEEQRQLILDDAIAEAEMQEHDDDDQAL